MKVRIALLIFYFIFFQSVHSNAQQAGTLDSTFSNDGIAKSIPANGSATSVAIEQDGKIVVGGVNDNIQFAVTRFKNNGNLDSSFGGNGVSSYDIGFGVTTPVDLCLQPDGKILHSGICINNAGNSCYGLARYNSDGTVDYAFSNDGQVLTSFNSVEIADYGFGVTLQTDGKIIQVGSAQDNAGTNYIGVVRFNADGTYDNSFGISGRVMTLIGNPYPFGQSVIVQPDSKILVGGYSTSAGFNSSLVLVRYNSNGGLDNSFGAGGKVITYFYGGSNEYDVERCMALQSDGKIILGGYVAHGATQSKVALVRYNSDGSIDQSFGTSGKILSTVPGNCNSIALQQDGKIIVVGAGGDSSATKANILLLRYNTDGTSDSSFGINGMVITSIDSTSNSANDIAIQDDGKIVIAGISALQGWIVLRYISGLDVGVLDLTVSENTLLIYPNPIQSQATLQYTLTQQEQISIELYDMQGKLVQEFITNETRTQGKHEEALHLNNLLPAGNYILSIGNGKNSQGVKVVKE